MAVEYKREILQRPSMMQREMMRRPSVMAEVDRDVAKIWGTADEVLVNDGTTGYSVANIKYWLSNWNDMFDTGIAESHLCWALVKADVLQAAAKLPDRLRRLFDLYCVADFSERQVCALLHWDERTFWRRWRELTSRICAVLRDNRIVERPRPAGKMQSAHGQGVYWWESVGVNRL